MMCQLAREGQMSALQSEDDVLRKWIDHDTGKLKFMRFNDFNLEERTVAGADLFRIRYYKTMIEASRALQVPYGRLRSRARGHQPVQANGGQNKALSPEEEAEVLMWAHRRITQGHHVKSRSLVQHANEIFAARGADQPGKRASRIWAQRFIKRNAHIFKRTATHSLDAKRKAGANRATTGGLVTYNPDVVLDKIQAPLSSLSEQVRERDLHGFIEEGGDEEKESHSEEEPSTSSNAQEGRADAVNPQTPPFTPKSARNDWRNASTPPWNLRTIQDYHDYVATRIESSILSQVPLTPSVIRTFSKARKAGHSLALYGITATPPNRASLRPKRMENPIPFYYAILQVREFDE
ncbi:hypothetical protein E4U32_006746 [Claviceps aff. humidiphila group G2b]|nr:hypothetical protein E4U32_006746 [Claviceps aff. humidiphila group G2b]